MRSYLIIGLAFLAAVVGCKKVAQPTDITTTPTFPVDDRNTNYRPGAGALKNTAQAGKRLAQLTQMEQLGTIMFALELQDNKMPTVDGVKADLMANPDARDLLKLINEGVIILTGTTDRQGMWAYEIDSDKVGGIILVSGRARRATADEVKKYLGQ